jgi:hypothetical protein
MTTSENISAALALLAIFVLFGIVGELEYRDIEYLEAKRQEQTR